MTAASDTRLVEIDSGARFRSAEVFESLFGSERVVVVADENTFRAAGQDVQDRFLAAGQDCAAPFIFRSGIYAEHSLVEELHSALASRNAIAVAVGSGTINDLTKLAAHRMGRPYMVVATAASMDGYTAYGASITYHGSKQTFDCPAPAAVLADLDVIAAAPEGLNASGYADLLAKSAAGADWILADAAGVEPIDQRAWEIVQGSLRASVSSPSGVRRGEPECLRLLISGLMMSGFAMQALRSSRPASGAEHQFSHLWDMQHHTCNGTAPSHGFKVGIGTLASLALSEDLLARREDAFAVDACVRKWPAYEVLEQRISQCLGSGELAEKAREETRAKYVTAEALRGQLARLREGWPALQSRLRRHLLSFSTARDMLREAGCASEPEQICISRERLRRSYEQAYFIRRRFTVLDFAERWGLTGAALDHIFGVQGPWPLPAPAACGAAEPSPGTAEPRP